MYLFKLNYQNNLLCIILISFVASSELFDEKTNNVLQQLAHLKSNDSNYRSPFPIRIKSLKIVGGTDASPNSRPWQVLLTDENFICGASVINNRWLLTAAHCFDDGRNKLTAYLGYHNLYVRSQGSKIIKIKNQIPHPKYAKETLLNDIKLLELEFPVNFNRVIQPVALPRIKEFKVGDVLIANGWGLQDENDEDSGATILQEVNIKVKQNRRCAQDWGARPLQKTQFCGGSDNPVKDTCLGDSGGALVKYVNNSYMQVGIVSFGHKGCNGDGVYTNVVEFTDWILDTVNQN